MAPSDTSTGSEKSSSIASGDDATASPEAGDVDSRMACADGAPAVATTTSAMPTSASRSRRVVSRIAPSPKSVVAAPPAAVPTSAQGAGLLGGGDLRVVPAEDALQ